MANLGSVLKSWDFTRPTEVRMVRAMVFPVVMYGCESWTVKKAEHQRTDALELWCWRRLLKAPCTERRSNQSILREINLEYSLEGLMLTKVPVFWSSDANRWLFGEVPDVGKDRGQEEKKESEDEMAAWHPRCKEHELGQTLGDGEGQRGLACCNPWGHKVWDKTGWLNNNLRTTCVCPCRKAVTRYHRQGDVDYKGSCMWLQD